MHLTNTPRFRGHFLNDCPFLHVFGETEAEVCSAFTRYSFALYNLLHVITRKKKNALGHLKGQESLCIFFFFNFFPPRYDQTPKWPNP